MYFYSSTIISNHQNFVSCPPSAGLEWVGAAFKKFWTGSGRVPPLPKCNMHLSHKINSWRRHHSTAQPRWKNARRIYIPAPNLWSCFIARKSRKVAWEMTDARFPLAQSWASERSRGFSSAQLLRCEETRISASRHSGATFFAGRVRYLMCVCDVQKAGNDVSRSID